MSATYEVHDGCTTCISDEGQRRYANEQRMDSVISVHTAITIGAALGLVFTFGALVITKILGA